MLRRLTFRSDPIINSFDDKTTWCGVWSEYGHNWRSCEIQLTGLDAKFVGYLKREVEDDVGQDVEEDDDEAHSEFEFHDVDVNDLND